MRISLFVGVVIKENVAVSIINFYFCGIGEMFELSEAFTASGNIN